LMIMDADGEEFAADLRRKMDDGYAKMISPAALVDNEATPLVNQD